MANEVKHKRPVQEEDWDQFLSELDDQLREPEAPKRSASAPRLVKKRKKRRNGLLIGILVFLCIVLVGAIGTLLLLPGLQNGFPGGERIPEGVSVAGLNLGGMSKNEAAKALQAAYGKPLEGGMIVTLPDSTLRITQADSGAALDAAGMAEAALTGTVPELGNYLRWNEAAVRAKLEEAVGSKEAVFVPSSFRLDGEVPPLEEDAFDSTVPCPNLVLNAGCPGAKTDANGLYDRVANAYLSGSSSVDASDMLTETVPEVLDLDAVFAQVCVNAVSAQSEPATSASYGLTFDLEAAREKLAAAGPGEAVVIPMQYVTPETLGQDAAFPDVLGFCMTPHSDNEDRNANLKLACASLNGVVMQPGDTLSYNATLGMRTEENGYKKAPAYSGTELVNSLGGGICQVSSTLYLCSLYAELETLERVSHGFPVNYIPIGLDATVSWGAPDLKIRNGWDTPVKIVAEVQDDFVCIWIMGRETRDYYVRMGFGSSGTYAKSYVCKYDRQTNVQLSREDHLYSAYLSEVDSILGEIGQNQIYRFGMSRDQEPRYPTQEALDAARRNIAPNAFGE